MSCVQEWSAHINGSLQIGLARKKLTASFPEIAASKIPAGKNGGVAVAKYLDGTKIGEKPLYTNQI